ncbi:MAG: TetR/AcrR family transcriptional regulator [Verrucomicrobiota bacterium]|jgi:AcrR family transcriptional regulator
MGNSRSKTEEQILSAALARFAHGGYAGASVQDIVDAAHVTKPTLYYYFSSKAALFQALVDSAHDERFRLMQEATKRGSTLEQQLVEILTSLFEYFRENRELMRLAFATAFAAPGELPEGIDFLPKCRRNYEFIHALVRQGQAEGELDPTFSSEALAYGILGLMNIYLIGSLLRPESQLNRRTAESIVRLYLQGAAQKTANGQPLRTGRSRR